jgi:hypothetical protein
MNAYSATPINPAYPEIRMVGLGFSEVEILSQPSSSPCDIEKNRRVMRLNSISLSWRLADKPVGLTYTARAL